MNPRKPKADAPWSPEQVGRRLRALRFAEGLLQTPPKKITQTEFAARAGLSQGSYTQYENAIRTPSIPVAVAICRAYGVTLDWLYTGHRLHMPFALLDAIDRFNARD